MKLLVVKVGGSLFSDKRRARTLDETALDAYAAAIAELARLAPGRVVFVSGGGAFGHDAVRVLDPGDPDAALPLTEAVFALKWRWTEALRAHGCRALPLQATSLAYRHDGRLQIHAGAVAGLLADGILPVLSGDAIGGDGRLEVVGSDRVAGLLLGLAPGAVRVAMLTDVPGVLTDGRGGSRVLREVDPDHPERALAAVWETPAWDTSRSMDGKLAAAIELARGGAECLIMAGEPRPQLLRLLLEPCERWPRSVRYTRISRAAAGAAAAG
ncbi:MAG TPA: hypothetical protein VFB52_06005 [Solirubrobacterales bacterium]|nr:hypothetical protein [Solirubrobacterales bacterium]